MNAHQPLFGDPVLTADRDEMKRFVATAFARCGGLTGWVALRAFAHEGGRPAENRWAPFDAGLVDYAASVATGVAGLRGAQRAVFSPPVCIFGDMMQTNPKGVDHRVATAANVVCGPCLAVEIDERPSGSLALLEGVLGPATIVVESGGRWGSSALIDNVSTEPKLHAYWRLGRPAVGAEALGELRLARALACRLVDGDATAVSVAHPMRWPGSWHTKNADAPVLCRVVGGDAARDVELGWCVSELRAAVAAAGLDEGGLGSAARAGRMGFKTPVEWGRADLDVAAALMPNEDLGWAEWSKVGMAMFDASHGSVDGLEAFHAWSEKSEKYDADGVDERWSHWRVSPPTELSAGTLLHRIHKEDPHFMVARDVADLWFEEPPVEKKIDLNAFDERESGSVFEGENEAVTAAIQEFAGGESTSQISDVSAPIYVRELNTRHAFVMNRGQAVVVNFETSGDVTFSNAASFFARYANRLLPGKKATPVGEAWFAHEKRREYVGGVEFDPRGVGAGVLNLWQGLPPLRGSDAAGMAGCALIVRHIRDVVCSGDDAAFAYLMGWLAHMVQRPGEKPGVAVVLRGKKGTGKDTLGEVVREMLGHYYMHAASSGVLMGRFNGHLAARLLLHVEEVAWEGSKRAEGVLKSLVTAPVMSIESKGVNAVLMRSALRILMTSNEDYVVPATADERRWFVLDVSDAHRRDAVWFGALRAEMEGNGPACLRRVLAEWPLDGFDVRDVPHTEALGQQQEESLAGFDRFWGELLEEGTAFEGWADGPVSVPRDTLRFAYEAWERKRGSRQVDTPEAVGRRLADFTGVPADKLSHRPRIDGKPGPRHYALPSLESCRGSWKERFSGK